MADCTKCSKPLEACECPTESGSGSTIEQNAESRQSDAAKCNTESADTNPSENHAQSAPGSAGFQPAPNDSQPAPMPTVSPVMVLSMVALMVVGIVGAAIGLSTIEVPTKPAKFTPIEKMAAEVKSEAKTTGAPNTDYLERLARAEMILWSGKKNIDDYHARSIAVLNKAIAEHATFETQLAIAIFIERSYADFGIDASYPLTDALYVKLQPGFAELLTNKTANETQRLLGAGFLWTYADTQVQTARNLPTADALERLNFALQHLNDALALSKGVTDTHANELISSIYASLEKLYAAKNDLVNSKHATTAPIKP